MARPVIEKLESSSLAEQTYQALREGIVNGKFAAGEHLAETPLATQLGTSRAPLREALRRLSEEGLVVERPRHGATVRVFSGEDFIDIYNMRLALESLAVRLVITREPPLDSLESSIDEMAREARHSRVPQLVKSELGFHEKLCNLARNKFLTRSFTSLSAVIQMALTLDDGSYENLDEVANEHVPVLDALATGDERKAVRAIQEHILLTVGRPLAQLGGDHDALLPPMT